MFSIRAGLEFVNFQFLRSRPPGTAHCHLVIITIPTHKSHTKQIKPHILRASSPVAANSPFPTYSLVAALVASGEPGTLEWLHLESAPLFIVSPKISFCSWTVPVSAERNSRQGRPISKRLYHRTGDWSSFLSTPLALCIPHSALQ